jgi:hypothetical protein
MTLVLSLTHFLSPLSYAGAGEPPRRVGANRLLAATALLWTFDVVTKTGQRQVRSFVHTLCSAVRPTGWHCRQQIMDERVSPL